MERLSYNSNNLSTDSVDEYKEDVYKIINKHKLALNRYPPTNMYIQGQKDLIDDLLKLLKK